MLVIVWQLKHSKYYTFGARKINIKTDHGLLKGLFKRDLADLENTKNIKIIERVHHYSIEDTHVSGRNNELPNTFLKN